jgi:hypothetical protein
VEINDDESQDVYKVEMRGSSQRAEEDQIFGRNLMSEEEQLVMKEKEGSTLHEIQIAEERGILIGKESAMLLNYDSGAINLFVGKHKDTVNIIEAEAIVMDNSGNNTEGDIEKNPKDLIDVSASCPVDKEFFVCASSASSSDQTQVALSTVPAVQVKSNPTPLSLASQDILRAQFQPLASPYDLSLDPVACGVPQDLEILGRSMRKEPSLATQSFPSLHLTAALSLIIDDW